MTPEIFNGIVADVQKELFKAPQEERDEFLLSHWGDYTLTEYHHTLGRHIRNNYNLWEYSWKPELRDGVDYSSFHPDNISQSIIEQVWLKGNERII